MTKFCTLEMHFCTVGIVMFIVITGTLLLSTCYAQTLLFYVTFKAALLMLQPRK